MTVAHDEISVKIHTAPDGIIWYSTGINPPECSGQILDTFLLSPVIGRLSTAVRILGVAQNAELISSLYLRKTRREIASVSVAGPNICESALELNDPVTALTRMREVYWAASRGGWHELSAPEYYIYALLARKLRHADWFDNATNMFYQSHPLYKVLNFIEGINHEHAVNLITTIIDPRWYVDRRRPDNPAKLNLYLGLTPKSQNRISNVKQLISKGRDFRCALVLNCWQTREAAEVDFDSPNNFLWRIWRKAGGGAKGDLRASQAFVHYLRSNWLEILTHKKLGANVFFLHDGFFKSDVERDAFLTAIA
jgi:hypothetical protein